MKNAKKSINILYHSTWLDLYPGGGEACDREIISCLNNLFGRENIFVDSIKNKSLFYFFKSTYNYKFLGKVIRDIMQFIIIFNSINLHLRKNKLKVNKEFIFFYSGRIGGLYFLKLFRPNLKIIYNLHGIANKLFFKKLCKKRNLKFILWGNAKDNFNSASLKSNNRKIINLIPSSDKLKIFKKEFIKKYPFIKKNNKSEKIKLIWIGRLEPIKNPIRLLDLAEKNNNIEIHIAGDGSLMKFLIKRIKEKKITNLKIHGYLDIKRIKKLISKSDFHIMTSKSENYPLVILEAMANRIISIVPNIHCFKSMDLPSLTYYNEDNLLSNKILKKNWNKKLEVKTHDFFNKISQENLKKSIKQITDY